MTPDLGVCYYPEQWPENVWVDDAQRMVEMGLSIVRIGEFAWSRLEPSEGIFDWDWLDRAIETLAEAGLKIILGTPSATPPIWMVEKFPDMLAITADGEPRKFGSRRHYCFSHDGYRAAAAQMAERLSKRYGQHPALHSWQTDNEYDCHETALSYSNVAREAFRLWLAVKYGTVATLNAAWGNVFWSMEYQDFAQVDLPNMTVTEPNPAHVMDFRRFSSDQIVKFNAAQVDAIRAHSSRPILHNYMGRITAFDHFKVGENLDIATWDSYPLGFLEDRSDQPDSFKHRYQRQGDPDFQAFHHDLYRAVGRGRWGVMEQQPGPVNWAPYNPAPLAGMVRLWGWEAIAHGAEFVNYFRWRQAPFAQEQMHAGLLRPDGVQAPGHAEVKQLADELSHINIPKTHPADVAIIFDYTSAWAWETQPQGRDFDYFRLVYDIYRGLRRAGLSVDILPPSVNDFGSRTWVLIPGLFTWTDSLHTAIQGFDGHVTMGPRTGSKTPNFQIPADLPPSLSGIKVTAVESLRPTERPPLSCGSFKIWREFVETDHEVVLSTEDGHAALVRKRQTDYLCGWPDSAAMDDIIKSKAKIVGLDLYEMPDGLRRRMIGPLEFFINYNANPVEFDGLSIPAADLLVRDTSTGAVILAP